MATFVPGQDIRTPDPTIEVTVTPQSPLPPGRHRFQLVVIDDTGIQSEPSIAEVIVIDDQKPTAVHGSGHRLVGHQGPASESQRPSDVAQHRHQTKRKWPY